MVLGVPRLLLHTRAPLLYPLSIVHCFDCIPVRVDTSSMSTLNKRKKSTTKAKTSTERVRAYRIRMRSSAAGTEVSSHSWSGEMDILGGLEVSLQGHMLYAISTSVEMVYHC